MLKANDFISDVNLNFKQKEITVKAVNGKDYKMLIDESFKKTKIVSLITDMVDRANYCKINDVAFNYTVCLWAMILRHFTNIKFVEYKDLGRKYQNEIDIVTALVNLEIIEDIINSFNPKEMNKITDLSKDFAVFTSYLNQVELDQMIDKLENEISEDIEDGEEIE